MLGYGLLSRWREVLVHGLVFRTVHEWYPSRSIFSLCKGLQLRAGYGPTERGQAWHLSRYDLVSARARCGPDETATHTHGIVMISLQRPRWCVEFLIKLSALPHCEW